jgi:branched-chain amino acid transport system permease protein
MLFELLMNGIVQGSLLALIATGYSLAYGTARVINFAHADVMIAGGGYFVLMATTGGSTGAVLGLGLLFGGAAAVACWLWLPLGQRWTWGLSAGLGVVVMTAISFTAGRCSFYIAVLIAIPLTAALAAAVFWVGYRPLLKQEAPPTSVLLASLGVSIALQSYLLMCWGSERRNFPVEMLPRGLAVKAPLAPVPFRASVLEHGLVPIGGGTVLPVYDLAILVVFASVAAGLALFFRYGRIADAIIATADARRAAEACGVPIDRVLGVTFFLGGAIAAMGGTLYVLRTKALEPQAGLVPGLLAFVACVVGGIGSLRGSIMGAFLVSLVVAFAPAMPIDDWFDGLLSDGLRHWLPSLRLGDWSYGVAYVVMIVVIMFRPRGLLSR